MLKAEPVGRFAPSPTGPLHQGSLLTAVASFLDIRARGGQWLIRIDDIDPPREVSGASQSILESLKAHGLTSPSPTQYQSAHNDRYTSAMATLEPYLYYCTCSRRDLAGQSVYPGTCRNNRSYIEDAAIRIDVSGWDSLALQDELLGPLTFNPIETGDFIVRRRDGLWAYNFATAVDDGHDVTHVLRGQDLTASTGLQAGIMRLLKLRIPTYTHLPLLRFNDGQKLSKQSHAPSIDDTQPCANLKFILDLLRQAPSPANAQSAANILAAATTDWQLKTIPDILQPFPHIDNDC